MSAVKDRVTIIIIFYFHSFNSISAMKLYFILQILTQYFNLNFKDFLIIRFTHLFIINFIFVSFEVFIARIFYSNF